MSSNVNPYQSIDPQLVLEPIVQHLSSEPDVFGVVYRRPGIADYTLLDMFYIPEQATWSIRKLPGILFDARPLGEHRIRATQPVSVSSYKIYGKQVNDFEAILPRQISSDVEGWRLEAWFRLDPRITSEDIMDRVHPHYRRRVSDLQIRHRRKEFRQAFNIPSWEADSELHDKDIITGLLEEYGSEVHSPRSTRGPASGLVDSEATMARDRITLQETHASQFDSFGSVAYWVYEAFPWGNVFWFSVGPVRFLIDVGGKMISSFALYESVTSRELYNAIIYPIYQSNNSIIAQPAEYDQHPEDAPLAQSLDCRLPQNGVATGQLEIYRVPLSAAESQPWKRAASNVAERTPKRIRIADIINTGLPTPAYPTETEYRDEHSTEPFPRIASQNHIPEQVHFNDPFPPSPCEDQTITYQNNSYQGWEPTTGRGYTGYTDYTYDPFWYP